MNCLETIEIVAEAVKNAVERKRLTGGFDLHLDCSQGSVCKMQMSVTEKKAVEVPSKPIQDD